MNVDQQNAAYHKDGSALVLAGPGTGKTRTLSERVRFLVQDQDVDPRTIMVTTFTRKAGQELKGRLAEILGEKVARSLTIGTFHSICLKILKTWPDAANFDENFDIIGDKAKKDIIRNAGVELSADPENILQWIERWKEQGFTPAQAYKTTRQGTVAHQAAQIFKIYEAALNEHKWADFPKIISAATRATYDDPRVTGWARTFKHILVDEFQDVNALQVRFVHALHAAGAQIWAVGDDDQAIYSFRGSDVSYILSFSRYFSDANLYQLRSVYRVPPSPLTGAETIARATSSRLPKEMRSENRGRDAHDLVSVQAFKNNEKEGEWIRSTVCKLINGGVQPNAIGVLFRTAAVAPAIERELRSCNVDISMEGVQNSWSTPEARQVVDALRMFHEPERQARFEPKSRRDYEILSLLEQMRDEPISKTGYAVGRAVAQNPPKKADKDRISQWADIAIDVGKTASRFQSYEEFLDYARRVAEGKPQDPENAVTLSTIHSAKGLEWSFVIIAGCEDGLIPHRDAESLDEERRLFYVAATRTKGLLVLTYAWRRFSQKRVPSRFIHEAVSGIERQRGNVAWPDRDQARKAAPKGGGPDEIDKRKAIVHGDAMARNYQSDPNRETLPGKETRNHTQNAKNRRHKPSSRSRKS